jgi:hypothetical protein
MHPEAQNPDLTSPGGDTASSAHSQTDRGVPIGKPVDIERDVSGRLHCSYGVPASHVPRVSAVVTPSRATTLGGNLGANVSYDEHLRWFL